MDDHHRRLSPDGSPAALAHYTQQQQDAARASPERGEGGDGDRLLHSGGAAARQSSPFPAHPHHPHDQHYQQQKEQAASPPFSDWVGGEEGDRLVPSSHRPRAEDLDADRNEDVLHEVEAQLVQCPNPYCNRKFLPDRLEVHLRSCFRINNEESVLKRSSPERMRGRSGSQTASPVLASAADPPSPPGSDATGASESGSVDGREPGEPDLRRGTARAKAIYQRGAEKFVACAHCGRTFAPRRLDIHQKNCVSVFSGERKQRRANSSAGGVAPGSASPTRAARPQSARLTGRPSATAPEVDDLQSKLDGIMLDMSQQSATSRQRRPATALGARSSSTVVATTPPSRSANQGLTISPPVVTPTKTSPVGSRASPTRRDSAVPTQVPAPSPRRSPKPDSVLPEAPVTPRRSPTAFPTPPRAPPAHSPGQLKPQSSTSSLLGLQQVAAPAGEHSPSPVPAAVPVQRRTSTGSDLGGLFDASPVPAAVPVQRRPSAGADVGPRESREIVIYLNDDASDSILGEVVTTAATTLDDVRQMIEDELSQPAGFAMFKRNNIPIHAKQYFRLAFDFFKSDIDTLVIRHAGMAVRPAIQNQPPPVQPLTVPRVMAHGGKQQQQQQQQHALHHHHPHSHPHHLSQRRW